MDPIRYLIIHGGAGVDPVSQIIIRSPIFAGKVEFEDRAKSPQASMGLGRIEIEVDAAE
jgi:hypothetical protein